MTRFPSNPSFRRRPTPRVAVLVVLLAACAAALAPSAARAAADVTRPLAPSNTALLARAADGAARSLVAQAPLTPGTRVLLRADSDGRLDEDMREALLKALNARKIACVLAPAAPGGDDGSAAAETPPDAPAATASPTEQAEYQALQIERAAQAARADSLARAAAGSVVGTPGDLPILTWRVQEARVDYVRQFRGGLLGAQRIERRARVDLALRLTPAGSDAVTWSATADTTVGDVVLRSELAALEDRTRPETRPQPPASSFKKVLEPALVVVLVAGLVSLFYQNRP
jgi:hypothetical protein